MGPLLLARQGLFSGRDGHRSLQDGYPHSPRSKPAQAAAYCLGRRRRRRGNPSRFHTALAEDNAPPRSDLSVSAPLRRSGPVAHVASDRRASPSRRAREVLGAPRRQTPVDSVVRRGLSEASRAGTPRLQTAQVGRRHT